MKFLYNFLILSVALLTYTVLQNAMMEPATQEIQKLQKDLNDKLGKLRQLRSNLPKMISTETLITEVPAKIAGETDEAYLTRLEMAEKEAYKSQPTTARERLQKIMSMTPEERAKWSEATKKRLTPQERTLIQEIEDISSQIQKLKEKK